MSLNGASPPTGAFEPTRWSLVLRARGEDAPARLAALETLCGAYWYPLYAFLRRSGHPVHDAEDRVQDFFAGLLDGSLLAGADPSRGKFRTLLLTALRNREKDHFRSQQALKRGGRIEFVHLDCAAAEERWLLMVPEAGPPERTFDRAWAEEIMARAATRLRAEHPGDKAALVTALAPRLFGQPDDEGLAAIGTRLGLSEAATKMALLRLRRRFAEIIRAEIAETVSSPADVEEEIRYLLAAFA